ncbi:DUF1572 domain-containing protein [Olivibacter sp. SDN3]|uniref:DUF1572 domain-containing protein n=1 Tax=Olivibacter sp. SDN3 TaxID=2764720 RepID=UPI0016512F51|nr:DUF1572 domain-containing protein [Olivibacter sp. SDN3]QNL48301.1 DUF1572 domain-containing protein [Olivibacter sp. SDN3]
MELSYELARRFREVVLNGTFIANTNYRDQLDGFDWKLATKELGDLNSIATLAQHIHYYVKGVKNAFKQGTLTISDKYSFDFPAITSSDQWEGFLSVFWNDSIEFAQIIEQMPEERLQEMFIDEKYGTYLLNIESMIEHCYYHLGQIVLLKKHFVLKT